MRLTINPEQKALLQVVREALAPGQGCFLVGGAVRDMRLGRPLHDLDFALAENPTRLAKQVAQSLGAGYFVLDDERHTARVVYRTLDGGAFPLDFVQFTGETLDADLRNRDFTINAMALSVHDLHTVIDPLGGDTDLAQKVLRPCSPQALMEDPVRVLRAVRLAKQFELAYAPGLETLARAAARNLPNTAAERQRDELFRILEGPEPAAGVGDVYRFGAFEAKLPMRRSWEPEQALAIMTYFQSMVYQLDPSIATSTALWAPAIFEALQPFADKLQRYFNEEITPGRHKSGLALLGILLYDLDVLELGPEGAWDVARRYQLSNAEADWVSRLVRDYQTIWPLAEAASAPDRRTVYRYFDKAGEVGVAIAVVCLADALAGAEPDLSPEKWTQRLAVVQRLLRGWWEEQETVVAPKSLLDGNELQKEFDLAPGAQIGALLEALKEAQASGEVLTRADARRFIALALRRDEKGVGR